MYWGLSVDFCTTEFIHRILMPMAFDSPPAARYRAGNMTKPVNFYCSAPQAQSVFLAGDFNEWSSTAHPMERRVDGCWFLQMQLSHGHHRYQFLVDGKPVLDPHATGTSLNESKEKVSVLAVS
jgi:1,4-alpha-glucan branching enzyme